MKRIFYLFLLTITALSLQAQDFQLYFANNVSDVSNLRSIRKSNKLNWQLVTNGALATNKVQVEGVKSMFASTDMKGREQQQQFWKMRDNNLLCFRINDGDNSKGALFEVRMYYNDYEKYMYLGVSNYFFVNIPHKDDKVTIKVNKKVSKDVTKTDTLTFTYQVFDWDNDRLYTFQLDSKRQAENRSYLLEYTTKKDGGQATTKTLELKNDKFQSFYVPEDETLTNVNLISANNGNQQKLKMDLNKLMYGVWLSDAFMRPRLETNFNLDKHANRELTIFNMLGTGLVEHFDTLYLTVHGRQNRFVKDATLNVVSLNAKGEYVADSHVKVDKYDTKKNAYRVITMGNPAYIEILASGYYPRLYRYPGASDPTTGVLDTKRCRASVTLISGDYDSKKEAISEQTIFLLKNLNKSVTVGDKKYQQFGIDSVKTETRSKESEVTFIEDGGYQDPKMLNGQQIDKYARMRITMSVPKGKNQQDPALTAKEKGGSTSYTFTYLERSSVLASKYPGLARDYYDLYYDLLNPQLPENKPYKLLLTIGENSFGKFPYLKRTVIDNKKVKKDAENQAKTIITPNYNWFQGDLVDLGTWNFIFSPSFNVNIQSFPGFGLSVIPVFYWDKQILDVNVWVSLAKRGSGDDESGKEYRESLKEANINNTYTKEWKSKDENGDSKVTSKFTWNTNNRTMGLKKYDEENWYMNEFDDIFKIQGNKLGTGWYLDGLVSVSTAFSPIDFYIKNITVTLGKGTFAAFACEPDFLKPLAEKLGKYVKFSAVGHAAFYGQGTIGIKRYGFKRDKDNNKLLTGKLGWLFDFESCLKLGVAYSATVDLSGGDKDSFWGKLFNQFFYFSGNARMGGKGQFNLGFGGPLSPLDVNFGLRVMGMIGFDFFFELKTPAGTWRPRAAGVLGNRFFHPKKPSNPYYPGYPDWLETTKSAPELFRRAEDTPQGEELVGNNPYIDFGNSIATNIAGDPVPTFLNDVSIALQNEHSSNKNSNHIEVYDTGNKTTTNLSTANRQTSHLSTATGGDYEVIGYSELTQEIDESAFATLEQRIAKNDELMQNARIVVKTRQGSNGLWKETVVPKVSGEGAAEGYIDKEPRVTIQSDGKMGCLWLHGKYNTVDYGNDSQLTDEEKVIGRPFTGRMMFSIYDGQQWSTPKALFNPVNENSMLADCQLVMSNDTLLMATNMATYIEKDGKVITDHTLWYHSCVNGQVSSTIDNTDPLQFSMKMVGDRVVCASIYETPDSARDIRVQAMNMRGLPYEGYATDLNMTSLMPNSLKVIADKTIDNPTDFAVLWTRCDNIVRTSSKMVGQPTVQTILNASRIYMDDNMFATPYITIGSTRDSLLMPSYDAYMDDNEIRSVYTLTNPGTNLSHVMLSTQEFFNDFEYKLSCNDAALVGGNKLPVDLTIYNTGTSPITSIAGKLNDKDITTMIDPEDVTDLYIAPNDKETITLLYPVTADFNGVILPKDISAEYENVFKASYSKRRGASLHRTVKPNEDNECELARGYEDISCQLVNHVVEGNTNTFEIEVTDHSLNGLLDNHVVYVGIYPGPCYNIPLCDTAEQTLTASDFQEVAGERKAYVTLTVQNAEETTWCYANAFIYDQRLLDISEDVVDESIRVVSNLSAEDCLIGVNLVPTEEDEVTGLPVVKKDDAHQRHITVTREAGGFRLSGLTNDDGHVRIFDTKATPVYSSVVSAGTMFVPITQHGIYLISTNSEVFKYNY